MFKLILWDIPVPILNRSCDAPPMAIKDLSLANAPAAVPSASEAINVPLAAPVQFTTS